MESSRWKGRKRFDLWVKRQRRWLNSLMCFVSSHSHSLCFGLISLCDARLPVVVSIRGKSSHFSHLSSPTPLDDFPEDWGGKRKIYSLLSHTHSQLRRGENEPTLRDKMFHLRFHFSSWSKIRKSFRIHLLLFRLFENSIDVAVDGSVGVGVDLSCVFFQICPRLRISFHPFVDPFLSLWSVSWVWQVDFVCVEEPLRVHLSSSFVVLKKSVCTSHAAFVILVCVCPSLFFILLKCFERPPSSASSPSAMYTQTLSCVNVQKKKKMRTGEERDDGDIKMQVVSHSPELVISSFPFFNCPSFCRENWVHCSSLLTVQFQKRARRDLSVWNELSLFFLPRLGERQPQVLLCCMNRCNRTNRTIAASLVLVSAYQHMVDMSAWVGFSSSLPSNSPRKKLASCEASRLSLLCYLTISACHILPMLILHLALSSQPVCQHYLTRDVSWIFEGIFLVVLSIIIREEGREMFCLVTCVCLVRKELHENLSRIRQRKERRCLHCWKPWDHDNMVVCLLLCAPLIIIVQCQCERWDGSLCHF